MNWWLRLLVFLLAFSVELRVHAAELLSLPEQKKVVEQPANCLVENDTCAIRTESGYKFSMNLEKGTVVLGSNTAVLRSTPASVFLLQGQVWVKSSGSIRVESEYGYVEGSKDFWVIRRPHDILARAIGEDVTLHLRGSDEVLMVKQGQENWVGAVSKGISSSGIPRTIALEDYLRNLASLYMGSKEEFRKSVAQFITVWREEVDASSEMQKQMLSRELASIQKTQEAAERQREQRAEEDRRLRKMFREKNNLD